MLTERGRKRASRGPGSSKDIQLGFQSRLWRKGTFVISPKYGKNQQTILDHHDF